MGPFLAVCGPDARCVSEVGGRAIWLLQEIAGLRAASHFQCGAVSIASFPRVKRASAPLLQDREGMAVTGSGTWFYGNEGGEMALRRFAADTHGLRELSGAAIRDLDGSFALCCHAPDQDGFSVVTDRIGTLHVFVRRVGRCTVVCGSSLVLAALGATAWDLASCREFLGMGTIFENRTLFRGIAKLPPAAVWSCATDGTVSSVKHWDLASHFYDRSESRGSVAALADSLVKSVGRIFSAYPRPVLDLTGGFDSRAVLAAALKVTPDVCTVVNGAPDSPDVIAANRIGRKFGLAHRHQSGPGPSGLWARAKAAFVLGDGECNIFDYAATLAHHETLESEFDVTVNGSNGELAKGYWWELVFPRAGARTVVDPRTLAAKRFVYNDWAAELLTGEEGSDLLDHFAGVIARTNAPLQGCPNTAQLDNVYLTLRMQRWQGRIASATNRVWPCAAPFAFRGPMELSLSAPPRTRLRNRMMRRLIEYLNPKLAAMPLAQGYPAQPLRIGTAHRFWPLVAEGFGSLRKRLPRALRAPEPPLPNAWFALLVNEEVCTLLRADEMATRELYDRSRLERFFAAARAPEFGGAQQLGRVLTLEMAGRTVRKYTAVVEGVARA